MEKNYYIMVVENQSEVRRVDISDDTCHYGYEPQSTLELKQPGRFALESLTGTLRGKAALYQFKKGDMVAVCIRFEKRKKKGEFVNCIIIEDIKLVKELGEFYL